MVEILAFSEEAAFAHRGVDKLQVICRDADEQSVDHVLALVPCGDGRQAKLSHLAKQLDRNGFDRGALLLDGHGVFVAKRLAQPLLARQAVRGAELQLVNPQRARSELLRHVYQLLVQSGDDGSDRDHRGGADEHAEDRQKRPEFVRAERVERQQQVFANVFDGTLACFSLSVSASIVGAFSSPFLAPRWGRAVPLWWRDRYRKRDRRRRKGSRPRSPRSAEPRL